ncbi:hypothetical protein Tco_1190903 [Tanacetum coccineum]
MMMMGMVVVRDDGGAWRGGWCRGGDVRGVLLVDMWRWCSVDVVTWGWRWHGDGGGAWRGGCCRGGDGRWVVLVDMWRWCSVDVVTWGWRWRGDSGVGWHGSGG